MKSTGIVRRVDDLGRMVLPVELRKVLDIDSGNSLEIFMKDNSIVLKKYGSQCAFCGQDEDIKTYKSRNICKNCMEEIFSCYAESEENIDTPPKKAI